MGSAKSKASNKMINETINNTMNKTLVNQSSKTTLSQEESNRTAQSIELYTDSDRAIKVAEEAANLAGILCKGEDLFKVGQCAKAIIDSFSPPACGGGLNIEQSSDMDLTSTQQLISTNAAEVESALKADLKTAYDNSQDGTADAQPPLLGSADSEVDQETRNTTINNTVNEIAMNMRSEIENFQKKNNDSSQAIKVEMFPGMSSGACNFKQDAGIKSISNIGTQAAMGTIAKAQMEVESDTSAKNTQIAKALSGGGGGMMGMIMVVIVIGIIAFAIKKMSGGGGGMSGLGAALSAPPPAAAPPPPVMYPVGQVVTLPSGQRALIQSFGKRMA